MSKQLDLLPEVVAFVLRHAPDSLVYLCGSLNFGGLRPDSDIDLVVVAPGFALPCFPDEVVEWEEPGFRLLRVHCKGMPVHIHQFHHSIFQELRRKPWRAYMSVRMEVLHDPEGAMQELEAEVSPWFNDHPEVAELWVVWMDQRKRRNVTRGEDQGDLIRAFPGGGVWWRHLDSLVAEGKA